MICWIHENSRVDGGSHFVSKEDIQEAHGGRFSGHFPEKGIHALHRNAL